MKLLRGQVGDSSVALVSVIFLFCFSCAAFLLESESKIHGQRKKTRERMYCGQQFYLPFFIFILLFIFSMHVPFSQLASTVSYFPGCKSDFSIWKRCIEMKKKSHGYNCSSFKAICCLVNCF